MAAGFAGAIVVGAALLMLPVAWRERGGIGAVTALFVSASATCVTGLAPIEMGRELSLAGQLIVLGLVQLGGLGIMTLGTFMVEALGRRMSMQDERVARECLGVSSSGGIRSLLGRAVAFAFFWEAAGAVALGARLYAHYGYSPAKAAYHGVFHAVSAFCNAGISLYADSWARFAGDPVMTLTLCLLVIVGGLGFIVLVNVSQLAPWRRNRLERGRLSLHARLVLTGTLILLALGTAAVWLLERHGVLSGLSLPRQWLGAFTHSVMFRSAGFGIAEPAALHGLTKAISMVFMVIGGAPGSTAGGIKVSTAMVLILTVWAMIRNREETEFARRTVPMRAVRQAVAIFVLSVAMMALMGLLLQITEARGGVSLPVLYETVSAFATTGLSLGVTPTLSVAGKLCVIVCMFVGRLGPLTIALTMGRTTRQGIPRRYPEEPVSVG